MAETPDDILRALAEARSAFTGPVEIAAEGSAFEV